MILVTGASGLVGSHLVKELSRNTKEIIALYNSSKPSKDLENLANWHQIDILDICALDEIFKNVKQVYHCAAIVSFNPKEKNKIHHLNIDGTKNIVNACISNKVEKLVHVSSVAALGRIRPGEKINETMSWSEETSNSEYGKTKYLSEMEVWRGFAEGLNVAIVNPSIILGLGNWNNGSTAIFKNVYNEFPWYTLGSSGFVDVKDVVNAMIKLMDSEINGEKFILNGWNLKYQEVFNAIAKNFNKKLPSKKVTPFIASIVWRIEHLKSLFNNKSPLLTRETAATALTNVEYDNYKLLAAIPEFNYSNFEESIQRVCDELKMKYQLK